MPTAPSALVEIALESDDLDGMVAFYEGLGLVVCGREPGRIWLELGSSGRIGIWSPGTKEHGDRGGMHVHFALAVGPDSLGERSRQLAAQGFDLEGPIVHEGGDRSIYVYDPEGNRVEL